MVINLILFLVAFFSTLQAEGLACEEPERGLRGLLLLGEESKLLGREELQSVCGLEVRDLKLPGSFHGLYKMLTPVYLHQELTPEVMRAVKRALYSYYQTEGDPFILVVIPEQNITDRVLQVKIYHAKLGTLSIEGVSEKKKKQFERYVRSQPGEYVKPLSFASDVNFINRNPFRRANVIYGMGHERGTTDVVISVQETPLYRFYSGFDNTGVKTIGQNRFFVGCTFNRVFTLDHIFSFQYTASPHLKNFQAFTGQYTAFLPCKHILNFYGGYSKLYVEIPSLSNWGNSSQASLRYTIPLPATVKIQHDISFGGDYKNTNNEIAFSVLFPNVANFVNLTQLFLGYYGVYENTSAKIETSLDLFWSPGAWLPNQTAADFSSLRPGATSNWLYGRGEVKYVQFLASPWSLHLCLRAQASTERLLPSEQFGIGGYDTVRGYDERQLNTDFASLASLEIRTPTIPVMSAIRKKTIRDSIQFLAFVDFGCGRNKGASESEENQFLLGIGPGARYSIDPRVTARCDVGIKLHRKDLFFGGAYSVHFSAIASF